MCLCHSFVPDDLINTNVCNECVLSLNMKFNFSKSVTMIFVLGFYLPLTEYYRVLALPIVAECDVGPN